MKESQAIAKELILQAKKLQELKDSFIKIEKEVALQEKLFAKKEQEGKQRLEQDPQYVSCKNDFESAQKQLAQRVYNEKEHRELQKKVEVVEKQLIELVELHQEVINQPKRAQEISQLITQLKEKKIELQAFEKELAHYAALEKELKELAQKEQTLSEQLQKIQERKEKAREQHGRIKTRQEQAVRLEKEQKKHAETIEKLNKEIEDYQTIASAAGKDGIQALLIEEAVPEIEQEANTLLSRLTNNQSQIFIESLRDLKGGGSKETLDINIADPSGIRPYEMFSGGEAFRIDFALRIAISKLLARRAGTALQTLIIDEGFGSQDEEGLSLIMDAIYKIQDDFEKVIVVSHLPGMHDQFPVHFVVRKSPNGSMVSVVEQG